ncbi:MAG: TIM-barrel domain-containing protein [Victivallales bacterium]
MRLETESQIELNSGELILAFEKTRERWVLNVQGDGYPLLVSNSLALLTPVLDGEPAALTLDAVETSGPSGVTLRFIGEAVEQLVLKVSVSPGYGAIDLDCEFIPRRDGQLNRLTLFPTGTKVSAYDLVNFRNRHFTPHTWPELNLGQAFETDTYSGDWMFAPHPSLFIFRKLEVNLFAGLFEVPYGTFGMHLSVERNVVRHWFLDYGTAPNGLALKAGETFRSPKLRLFAHSGKTVYDMLDAFSGMLIHAGQTPDPAKKRRPAWWTEPLYCTWGDQVAKSRSVPAVELQEQSLKPDFIPGSMLNEAFIREAAALILREKLPIRTILIDEGWSVARGQWETHPKRFPNLRGLVDDLHRQGFKVVVWLAWTEIFDDACVPSEFLVGGGQWLNRHGRRFTDYSSPHTQKEYLAPLMRQLFSAEPGCYDLDGLKTDFQADKIHPEMPLADPAWRGEENFLCRMTKLLSQEMKLHKPDAMHLGCAGHFWLAPWIDVNRTYDVFSNNYLEHEQRCIMLRHTAPGCPVSYDIHISLENLDGWFASARRCGASVEIGNLSYVGDTWGGGGLADECYYNRLRTALGNKTT